ncbi:putative double-stranded RNA-binding domain-containing protein [Lupinus albus]|uniref:Putative double-stranded RNA-binding domain-containing protein n=1 Tax=Lupinus albus TaxID=3870 RepID=A0A6A4NZK0_LUPAL|nr:putative double-stranded RNA-binding domain-containing protein [Lupinus albus]
MAVFDFDNCLMINTQFIRPETGHPRKSQLQNYARRSNPDPSIFSSKTEAEQSVAEVPLMSLSIDISEKAICILFIQGECSSSFKNKLQELTQRKCFGKPTYKTTQSGYPNMPTFFSTVEVESMEFHGKAAKSKKEAQQNAANVAYLALKECKFVFPYSMVCIYVFSIMHKNLFEDKILIFHH